MADRLTDEQYAAIEAANANVRLVRIPTAAGEIVIRAPTVIEESNFQQMAFGTQMLMSTAWRNLLTMVAVHPDKTTLKSWLDTWTGIPINPRVIKALKTIRGEADEEEAK